MIRRKKKWGHSEADTGLRTFFLLGEIFTYLWVPGKGAGGRGELEVTRKKSKRQNSRIVRE